MPVAGNPYRPGFAEQPPVLAGREDDLAEMRRLIGTDGLGVGSFRVIYGQRGLGKTSLLTAFQQLATAREFDVITIECQPDAPLLDHVFDHVERLDRISRRVRRSVHKLRNDWGDETQRLKLGIYEREARRQRPEISERISTDLKQILTAVVEEVTEKRSGLMILVDEAQNAQGPDLAAIGSALDGIAKARVGPCIVVFSGLNTLPGHIGDHMSYGERLAFSALGRLTPAATTHALVQPALDTGRRFEPDALHHLTDAIDGYPYFVQLFGFHTTEAAGNSELITFDHAQHGVAAGRQAARDGLYRLRWHRLTPAQRDYLYATARISIDTAGAEVSTRAVADILGRKASDITDRRSELILAGAIHATRQGYIASDLPGFFGYVINDSGHSFDSEALADRLMPSDRAIDGTTTEL